MYELNFNIKKVLEELNNLSAKEKCDALNKIYDEMEIACNTIMETQYDIFDQYEKEKTERIIKSVKEYIEKNGLQSSVVVIDNYFEMDFENNKVQISPVFSDFEDLYVCFKMKDVYESYEVERHAMTHLAEITGTEYVEERDSLFLKAEEDELASKIIEMIEIIRKSGSEGQVP